MPTAHAFSGAPAGVTSSATAKSPVELVQARKKGRRGARRGKRRRGKNIGKGIAAGAAAAILLGIAAEAANADDDDDRGYCRRLAYKCDDGRDWACRKFDRNCD